jgi:hypothetical protein
MNESDRHSAKPKELSHTIHQQLNMYALAAGTAGVALLALAQPAEAKIVFTPAHVPILGPKGFFALDLNHDGVVDFNITNTTQSNTDQAFWNLFAQGPNKNAVAGTFVYRGFPADAHAFNLGQQIGGAGEKFFPGANKLVSFYVGGGGYSAHGNWVNLLDRYLGVRFQVGNELHYGWVRFTVQVLEHPVRINALLTGYAYETVPGKPIAAGATSDGEAQLIPDVLGTPTQQPATLGLLAAGAPGLWMWRRKETAEASS